MVSCQRQQQKLQMISQFPIQSCKAHLPACSLQLLVYMLRWGWGKDTDKISSSLVQVASFPFKGNTSFLIILPRGNLLSVLSKLNISDLYRSLPQEKLMQVNLPKLKLEYQKELQAALTNMGKKLNESLKTSWISRISLVFGLTVEDKIVSPVMNFGWTPKQNY